MAVYLDAYPKLTRERLSRIGLMSDKYSFYYENHLVRTDLKTDNAGISTSRQETLKLSDPKAEWHPEKYELRIDYSYTITTPVFLFGPDGLVARNGGKIGLAILWMDADANCRGVFRAGDFGSDTAAPFVWKGSETIPSGMLRGDLILRTIMYVADRGNPVGREKYLAGENGTVLGTIDETRVIVDGNGALFPIHEASEPGSPLWWVRCDWSNAAEDKFSEDNFCVYLNTAHRDYASLNASEGMVNSPLLQEIICSALEILITRVMHEPGAKNYMRSGDGIIPGSVASVVRYLMSRYDLVFSDTEPQVLALDLRKIIMQLM